MIESKDNWNYSRSLLFAWAIPYYHFGLRSSLAGIEGGDHRRAGGQRLEQRNRPTMAA